jgi:hypothetical protein
MRIVPAALIGGTLFWLWGAIAHMLLPIGEMGIKTAVEQDAAIAALQASATSGEGVYMIPGMDPASWGDEAVHEAFVARYKDAPYALVVYRPAGNPGMVSMVPNLVKHWLTSVLAALLAAWILALGAFGFGQRVLIATGLGLFAWLAVHVPYWNWYLFPTQLTIGAALEQAIGWAIAGAGMAWWLGRRKA